MNTPITAYRTQFTFKVDNKTLGCFFAKLLSGVNMTAILVTKIESTRCNFVRTVVGSADPTNPTNGAQVEATRIALRELNISYKEKQVIQLLNVQTSPTPGALFSFYNSFFCTTGIKAIYIGEPAANQIISVYFDVSLRFLETANQLILNPQDNCINRDELPLECPSCNIKESRNKTKTPYRSESKPQEKKTPYHSENKPQEKRTERYCPCRDR